MFIDQDAATGQGDSQARRRNLQNTVSKLDRIVSRHDAFVVDRENPIEIQMRHRHKGSPGLRRFHGELFVKFRDVLAAQQMIRLIGGLDIADPRRLRQSTLPGSTVPFTSTARLRRISRYGINTDILESATDFGVLARIDRLAGLRCAEEMAGSVTVER